MKLSVSKFILPFVLLLGLFRPLYAMRDWRGLSIRTYLGKYYVYAWDSVEEDLMSITFDNAKERKKFLDALYERTGLGMSSSD